MLSNQPKPSHQISSRHARILRAVAGSLALAAAAAGATEASGAAAAGAASVLSAV